MQYVIVREKVIDKQGEKRKRETDRQIEIKSERVKERKKERKREREENNIFDFNFLIVLSVSILNIMKGEMIELQHN